MNTNLIRFSGMASGMDTESIVKQLMQAKRYKVNKYEQAKTKNEWRQEAYHNVNKDLANFIVDSRKKLGLTKYTYTGQLYPNSINNVDWAKKATSSNESYFTAKATAGAAGGSYDVQIKQLAQGANITGEAISGVDLKGKIGSDSSLKINVNGEEKVINIKSDDTMSDAIRKIREESGLNVSFGKVGQDSSGNDTFMLFVSSKNTGALQSISSNDADTQAFFEKFGVSSTKLSQGSNGKNSIVNINGSDIENQSNDIDINGIQLSLKKVTDTTQSVSVSTDVDGIYDKIKEFVEGYNKVIGNLQDKLKEKQYRDYQPLIKEQKENMKDEEVKLWEEKSKSGVLRDDMSIKSMISNIRAGAYEKVEGASAMYNIGITTGSYKNGAKLEINEDKLKAAISKNPQEVLDTLFKSSDDIKNYKIEKGDSAEEIASKREAMRNQRANTGVFVRIMDDMSNGIESIVKQAGTGKDSAMLKDVRGNILVNLLSGKSSIDKDIYLIEKNIDDENRRLSSYETALWKKFGAMEKAIQQMQGQSGWLSQQFGGR